MRALRLPWLLGSLLPTLGSFAVTALVIANDPWIVGGATN